MSGKITIIGLGEIGLSLAMAFKARGDEFVVTGNDLKKDAERFAMEHKHVDRIEHNLFNAVKEADAILLAIPADQTKKTLELIGQDLGPDVIAADWCADKSAALHWARQNMGYPENFIGVWAGGSLSQTEEGGKTGAKACEDYFKGGSLFIAAQPDTSEKAITFASSLADLLGMDRSFAEPAELDGMLSAVFNLPHVCASAMMECLSLRSGWSDAKRCAGKEFARMTSLIEVPPDREDCGTTLLNNRENTIRMLDEYMNALKSYRDALQKRDAAALKRLYEHGEDARRQWKKDLKGGGSASSEGRISASDTMVQSIFGVLLRKKNRS